MNLASAEKKENTLCTNGIWIHGNEFQKKVSRLIFRFYANMSFQVKMALQQEGFDRKKRGYRDINEIDINMNDPLFTKQWYLVSISILFLTFPTLSLWIKDAFLFPHSVGSQPASDSMNLSVHSDTYWFSITTHTSCSLICFILEPLNNHDLLGSKQLSNADKIAPDSEKAHQCRRGDLQNHVEVESRVYGE